MLPVRRLGRQALRGLSSTLVAALLAACASTPRTPAVPAGSKDRLPVLSPGPREGHALEFLPNLERVMLVEGGSDDDTSWAWDGRAWEPLEAGGGPAPRALGGTVYWPPRAALLSYGGLSPEARPVPETWKFDGARWVHHDETTHPPATDHFGMELDLRRSEAILFGGRTEADELSDETWRWDSKGWSRVSSSGPPGRLHGAMAYDPADRRIVLFGGDPRRANGTFLADTWTWTGRAWNRSSAGRLRPGGRADADLAFHPGAGGVVLFGGVTAKGGYPNDTWVYDRDGGWRRIDTADAPPGRIGHALAYDPNRGVIVLYGGFAGDRSFTDVWEFDGASWMEATPALDDMA